MRAHLGNYALWLSGLFPDYIEARHWRRGAPDLDYYEEMGRRGSRSLRRTNWRTSTGWRRAVQYGGASGSRRCGSRSTG